MRLWHFIKSLVKRQALNECDCAKIMHKHLLAVSKMLPQPVVKKICCKCYCSECIRPIAKCPDCGTYGYRTTHIFDKKTQAAWEDVFGASFFCSQDYTHANFYEPPFIIKKEFQIRILLEADIEKMISNLTLLTSTLTDSK